MDGNPVEQVDDIMVCHAYAACGSGLSKPVGMGCAVNVDIPFPAVDTRPPVDSFFHPLQPEDACGNAVQTRWCGIGDDIAGGFAAFKHLAQGGICADAGADTMKAGGRLATVGHVSEPFDAGGDGPAIPGEPITQSMESLQIPQGDQGRADSRIPSGGAEEGGGLFKLWGHVTPTFFWGRIPG